MTRVLPASIFVALVFASSAAAQTPGAVAGRARVSAAAPASRVAALQAWLTGEFDNFQQFTEEKEAKARRPHDRVHLVITPVMAPSLGSAVLLASESALNDPERIARVLVYSLIAVASGGEVEQRVYVFADEGAAAAAAGKGGAERLPLDRVHAVEGCTIRWQESGGAFAASLASGACSVSSVAGHAAAPTLMLSRAASDELWLGALEAGPSGQAAAGAGEMAPYKLKRARIFNCYAAVRKEGSTDQYDGFRDIAVHDQGKMVSIPGAAGEPSKYAFELSQLRYNQQLPVMKLALYDTTHDQAFAYSWAETTSVRIGINLRWIQVGCSPKVP
ncbi:MAG: CpcT/CpeT family chromophore lyase [Acidobacteriota bacterium]